MTTTSETQETEIETLLSLFLGNQSFEEREENGVSVLLKELVELGALHPKKDGNLEIAGGCLQQGATCRQCGSLHGRQTQPTGAPRPNDQTARPEDPTIAALKAEGDAMWARNRDAEGATGPSPPPHGRWLAGEV
jgi:hypothetical protein